MPDTQTVAKTITFVLDGREVSGRVGETIIQVADREGIYIPRFCYHERLSVAANCRMCLVEVNQGKKTLPACHASISQDMVVNTKSAATKKSQQSIMEFLLINHPLDCPICDQGGQCELQDLAMGFGKGTSRYDDRKRAVVDEDLGPLVATDMTRCIHCTRCVRFGTEISGVPDLGTLGRGEDMRILSYLKSGLQSEMSGNMIDLCPVGALTSKPLRYQGRSWSFINHPYYAAHDCLHSHIYVHTYDNGLEDSSSVMRVVPRRCEAVNAIWISDRDRFSYLGLQHQDRLSQPMIRDGKTWRVVDWETALTQVAEKIQMVLKDHGPEQIGALLSPNSTIEEGFICQKLLHALGCRNMDYRHHQKDTDYIDSVVHPLPVTFLDFDVLSKSDCVLLVGSHIRHEQPVASLRLRAASLGGTKVLSINPIAYDWNFECADEAVVAGQALVEFLASCIVSLADSGAVQLTDRWRERLVHVKSNAQSRRFAKVLIKSHGYIILGHYAQSHPQASIIHKLCAYISSVTKMKLVIMTPGTNSTGLHTIGFGPCHRVDSVNLSTGESSYQMIDRPKRFYLLQQTELEYDHYDASLAISALERAETVVAVTSFTSPQMLKYADILLPAACWGEFSGTWMSLLGEVNSFRAIKPLFEESKSVWKIYRVLGNMLRCDGFSYHDISELRAEIPLLQDGYVDQSASNPSEPVASPLSRHKLHVDAQPNLVRIGESDHYQIDGLVRRSEPLQALSADVVAKIHPHTAKSVFEKRVTGKQLVQVKQGRHTITCPLVIDENVALNAVQLPISGAESDLLSGRHDPVSVSLIEKDESK